MAQDLGRLLRDYRLAAGLTQEALAEQAGLSPQAIGALERGDRRHPHRHTTTRLVAALGLTDEQRAELVAAARRVPKPRPAPERLGQVAPRQLPAPLSRFTGRKAEAGAMLTELTRADGVPVCAVTGMAGVGKTTLALQVAHEVSDHFPDGQVYLDLRGFDRPLDTRVAMSQVLHAIGIRDLSDEGFASAATYRSAMADRRMLLILDNAANSRQVADLLPGAVGSAAIVTSRQALDALPHAFQVRLDVLTPDEGLELLATVLGQDRVDAEYAEAGAVVSLCGRLPLAIQIAGARLAARPRWPIEHLVDRLADERRRLDELQVDDVGVRACFAMSSNLLDEAQRLQYAMLGLLGPGDLSVVLAARLLDVSEDDAEATLERLTDLALVEAVTPGWYRMHDLLRSHAQEQAQLLLDDATRTAAVNRVAALVNAVAWRSSTLFSPASYRVTWADDSWADGSPRFATSADAFTWLDEHRHHVSEIATTDGVDDQLIVRLSVGLFSFYLGRGHLLEWHVMTGAAHAAAQRGTSLDAIAMARMDHGMAIVDVAITWAGDPELGLAQLRQSLAEFRALGDPYAEAACLINITDASIRAGDLVAAQEYAEAAANVSRELSDDGQIGVTAYLNLGDIRGKAGDHERQVECYREGLSLLRAGCHEQLWPQALVKLGSALRRTDRHEAVELLTRGAAISEKIGDLAGQAACLEELGRTHLDAGRASVAHAALLRSLTLARQVNDSRRVARIRQFIA